MVGFLLALGARAEECTGAQQKTAHALFLKHIHFRLKGSDEKNVKIDSCLYNGKDETHYQLKFKAHTNGISCDLSFDLELTGTTFIVNNEAALNRQVSRCRTAPQPKVELEAPQEEQEQELAKLPDQLPQHYEFDEQLHNADFMQGYLDLTKPQPKHEEHHEQEQDEQLERLPNKLPLKYKFDEQLHNADVMQAYLDLTKEHPQPQKKIEDDGVEELSRLPDKLPLNYAFNDQLENPDVLEAFGDLAKLSDKNYRRNQKKRDRKKGPKVQEFDHLPGKLPLQYDFDESLGEHNVAEAYNDLLKLQNPQNPQQQQQQEEEELSRLPDKLPLNYAFDNELQNPDVLEAFGDLSRLNEKKKLLNKKKKDRKKGPKVQELDRLPGKLPLQYDFNESLGEHNVAEAYNDLLKLQNPQQEEQPNHEVQPKPDEKSKRLPDKLPLKYAFNDELRKPDVLAAFGDLVKLQDKKQGKRKHNKGANTQELDQLPDTLPLKYEFDDALEEQKVKDGFHDLLKLQNPQPQEDEDDGVEELKQLPDKLPLNYAFNDQLENPDVLEAFGDLAKLSDKNYRRNQKKKDRKKAQKVQEFDQLPGKLPLQYDFDESLGEPNVAEAYNDLLKLQNPQHQEEEEELKQLPDQLPLSYGFNDELAKEEVQNAYLDLLKLQSPEMSQQEEEELAKEVVELASHHGMLKRQNTPSDLFKQTQDSLEQLPRKVVPKQLMGGWGDCDADQAKHYAQDLREHLKLGGVEGLDKVRKCEMQVVAGLKVKLSVGSDAEHECETTIFYPLKNGAPQFEVSKKDCVPGGKLAMLMGGALAGGWKPCSAENKQKAYEVLLSSLGLGGGLFAPTDVLECSQQVVAGLKVKLSVGKSADAACEASVYFPLLNGTPEPTITKTACVPQESKELRGGLAGGWSECSEAQKQQFRADFAKELALSGSALASSQVLQCSKQVVAGLKVKLSIGKSADAACETTIFYPLLDGAPEFEVTKRNCMGEQSFGFRPLEAERQHLLGGWTPCSDQKKKEYLSDLLGQLGLSSTQFGLDQVRHCEAQLVSGTNVHLIIGTDAEHECAADIYYPIAKAAEFDIKNRACMEETAEPIKKHAKPAGTQKGFSLQLHPVPSDVQTEEFTSETQEPIVYHESYTEVHKEHKPEKPHLLGGWEPCGEYSKQKYLGDFLNQLGVAATQFGVKQVSHCESQVVYGWNVRIAISNEAGKECSASAYYPPEGAPQFTVNSRDCIDESDALKGGLAGGWSPCTDDQKHRALDSFRTELGLSASRFSTEDVSDCYKQVVAGLKMRLKLGAAPNQCEGTIYYPLLGQSAKVELTKRDCAAAPHDIEEKDIYPLFERMDEQQLEGGWSPCSAETKKEALGDVLGELHLSAEKFGLSQVRACSEQIVAGMKVRITIGADAQNVCEAEIFYPLMNGKPEVTLSKSGCGSAAPAKCSEFVELKALEAFRAASTGDLQYAFEENVVECSETAGTTTAVRLRLSFNSGKCEFEVSFTPAWEARDAKIHDCPAE